MISIRDLTSRAGDREVDFELGRLVNGKYKILNKLGRGGMGVVYRCLDSTADVDVAMKTIAPELSGNDREMRSVKANYQLVHNLHHPHIANYNSLERDQNGDYFLIMEYVDGEVITDYLDRQKENGVFSEKLVARILKAANR